MIGKNFTMVSDELVDKYGLVCAAVYGAIERYAMQNGICSASQQKIADRVGLSPRTVIEHEQRLISDGLLIELPSGPGETKRLVVTKRLTLTASYEEPVQEMQRGYAGNAEGYESPAYKDTNKIQAKREDLAEPEYVQQAKQKPLVALSKPLREVTVEDCDIDGIPDSWKEETKKKKIFVDAKKSDLASRVAAGMNIVVPRASTKSQFAQYRVTWWAPIERMLELADGDTDKAEHFALQAINKLRGLNYTIASPKSLVDTFTALISESNSGIDREHEGMELRFNGVDYIWVPKG
jgi:hypothetical protein